MKNLFVFTVQKLSWPRIIRLRDFLQHGKGWIVEIGPFHLSSLPREAVVQSWATLDAKQNEWPKPRNMNSYINLDMYSRQRGEWTFVIQKTETEEVHLLDVKNAPEDEKETISALEKLSIPGEGYTIIGRIHHESVEV